MHITRADGVRLAYALTPGTSPTIVFLPGFMSDMTGDKALAVEAWCRSQGRACLRLDYSGHGASGGRFEDGGIGLWTEDALLLIDTLIAGPLVLVGSSMGGWIALNVALRRPNDVAALVGIAAAPDFTETLMWPAFTTAQRATLMGEGVLRIPSQYGGEQIITRTLIEDGRLHLLLSGPIPLRCPVRLLHGQRDPDVPWPTALQLAERLESDDVGVTLIKDGEHRLSRPQDIALLIAALGELVSDCAC
jgi:pimeloyl-ACP methyl ester carboxylesterase